MFFILICYMISSYSHVEKLGNASMVILFIIVLFSSLFLRSPGFLHIRKFAIITV